MAGAQVVGPAPSVRAALALIGRTARLDGAVLDIDLRGETAFPVADRLIRRRVPFLFATGYDAAAISHRFAHVTRCEKSLDPDWIVPLLLEQQVLRHRTQAAPPEQGRGSSAG